MARLFALVVSVTAVVAVAPGCTDPVREQEIEELGPEEDGIPPGPDHRPGQPCLHCHSEGGPAEAKPFAIAGTIYKNQAPDSAGAEGVTIGFVDANNGAPRELPVTNATGNFWVPKDLWPDMVFPIRVGLYPGENAVNDPPKQTMKSLINREGSCNFCHRPNLGSLADFSEDEKKTAVAYNKSSAGQIFLEAGGL